MGRGGDKSERVEWSGLLSRVRLDCGFMWVRVGHGRHVRHGRCIQASPNPPQIWAGFEGCRLARTFVRGLRSSTKSFTFDWSVTGRLIHVFETDMKSPVVDALNN